MKSKLINSLVLAVSLLFFAVSGASAHVVVKPDSVGVAQFQTFTMGVPNEKDNPTTKIQLVVPQGLNHVTPNVKPGWTIEIKKDGNGEEARVTEIIWSGGSIPAGQRDDFLFSAQVPSLETKLAWKAYQTYQNNEVVAWDLDPNQASEDDDHAGGPYSVTKVVDDLTASTTTTGNLDVSWIAFGIGLMALILATRNTVSKK